MKYKKKIEIIKHIQLGTSEVLYFPYEGKYPLPLRPISSYEFDDCFYKALENAPGKIAELVIKLRLKLIETDRDIDVSDKGYAQLQKFYDSMSYWVVYYSMKDFQDEEFSIPNYEEFNGYPNGYYITLKMNDVHDIAEFILNGSYQNDKIIKEIFEDELGREVAYSVTFLKHPLADLPKLTKLQKKYLIYSNTNLPGIIKGSIKEDSYVTSDKTYILGDFLKRFG